MMIKGNVLPPLLQFIYLRIIYNRIFRDYRSFGVYRFSSSSLFQNNRNATYSHDDRIYFAGKIVHMWHWQMESKNLTIGLIYVTFSHTIILIPTLKSSIEITCE